MRVLLVNAHGADQSVGGAERYVARLGEGLRGRGVEVSLLAAFPAADHGPFTEIRVLHGSDWRTSQARRLANRAGDLDARVTSTLTRAVAAARPDLVHTNNLAGITTAVWGACARAGIPVVHTLHDYALLCARATLVTRAGERCRPRALGCGLRARRLRRWAYGVGSLIGVSRHVLAAHAGFFPADTAVRVILHPRPAPATGDAPAPPAGERLRTLGYIGALDVVKGVGVLLDAAPALARLDVRVRLAGAGRLRPEVERAHAADLLDFDGVVGGAAKQRFLERCDAGVVPSVWDEPGAPPYVALEWLGAGRPVLASRRGGLGEAAQELPGLRPVEPSVAGIVEGCRALLAPDTWAAAVERAALPVALSDDEERWLGEHLDVYTELLGRR